MGKKRPFRSKEDRDAWNAHVDETLARLWELATKAQAELDAKKARRSRLRSRSA